MQIGCQAGIFQTRYREFKLGKLERRSIGSVFPVLRFFRGNSRAIRAFLNKSDPPRNHRTTRHKEQTLKPSIRLRIAGALAACFILTTLPSAAQDTLVETVRGGVEFRLITKKEQPWAIQVLQIDRAIARNNLGVAIGGQYVMGLEPLDGIIGRLAKKRPVLAAINGDFFVLQEGPFQGDLIGFCVVDGEMLSHPIGRSTVVILEDGTPIIDRFSFEGSVTDGNGASHSIYGVNQRCPTDGIVLLTPSFNTETRPVEESVAVLVGPLEKPLGTDGVYRLTVRETRPGNTPLPIPPHTAILIGKGGGATFLSSLALSSNLTVTVAVTPSVGPIRQAIGGMPRLIRDGAISIEAAEDKVSESFVNNRHPRTAFGFNDDRIIIVTVDGRQEGYSAGMSLPELADIMQGLGATQAVNLDGGGSTTMWVNGSVRNRPSDGKLRSLGNGLFLYGEQK